VVYISSARILASDAFSKLLTLSAGKYTIKFNNVASGQIESMDVDYIIGADGANSRVAKAIDAGTPLILQE
jgi:2-polyprenyl-6-methoxyphenol hydroxylase-like FAD-dependent oxidoreductase